MEFAQFLGCFLIRKGIEIKGEKLDRQWLCLKEDFHPDITADKMRGQRLSGHLSHGNVVPLKYLKDLALVSVTALPNIEIEVL